MKKLLTRQAILKLFFMAGVIYPAGMVSAQAINENKALVEWRAGTIISAQAVKAFGITQCFKIENISDKVFMRMNGKSYQKDCPIPRSDLRYIKALHYDINGKIHIGEMVCNKAIAQDLVEIFQQLYEHRYPIERMVLIDEYNANDEQSMRANNSSGFCYRNIGGSSKPSKHGLGMAVDLNTLYNPYYKKRKDGSLFVQPSTGKPYCNRQKEFPYKIRKGDLCYKLFISHGFRWGGNWRSCKDYQHFEK